MVPASGLTTIVLTAASLAASAGGVWLSIRLARRWGVMDVPNPRSSHVSTTPRMGGVPMVFSAVLAFAGWSAFAETWVYSSEGIFWSVGFALSMCALGFWDDMTGLSPFVRLFAQVVGAGIFAWSFAGLFPKIPIWGGIVPQAVWIAAVSIWIAWMVNLYNFMDGIDGLAGGEAAVVSLFFFLLYAHHGESGWAILNLFVAAAAMGFLVHNWPPAHVFMGDAGSAYLGAFYGMQSVVASLTTSIPFLVLVIPLANFILDTTATLVRRLWRGETWHRAHRTHLYQRLTKLGMSHARATSLELVSGVALCGAAEVYLRSDTAGRVLIVVFILATYMVVEACVARKETQRASAMISGAP